MNMRAEGQPVKRGEVRAVRQLRDGVQAEVCLGASAVHGSAVVRVVTRSPKVLEALAVLHAAIREEAMDLCKDILADAQVPS